MQINDLIFKELIKRGYALEGKTRVWNIADSKLWYLTSEQAQAYLDLENSNEYNKAVNKDQGESLMLSNAKLILEKLGKNGAINVVDLGCGDGKKAGKLIKALDGKVKIRYCPIDISGYMVQKAIETFSKMKVDEIIEFQYNISDFENLENITPLLIKDQYKRNLFLLLGNTLGNFEINELLYEIRSAMKDKDLLLVDTAVADENIQKKTELQAKNKKVESFLIHIPLQLGLKKENLEYGARFKNSRIEFYFSIKDDQKIEFQGKTVLFNKGDQIIVAIAYKHDKEDLKAYFNMYFNEADILLSKDDAQAFVLCAK
ncbi:MAG: L-histidine N(alpha)-methyltransferase [Nanoarchaeota archaeon]